MFSCVIWVKQAFEMPYVYLNSFVAILVKDAAQNQLIAYFSGPTAFFRKSGIKSSSANVSKILQKYNIKLQGDQVVEHMKGHK